MTLPDTERIPIRSHWPSGSPYSPSGDKQFLAIINSPPDMTVLFPSAYQTDAPLYCFILWPFPTQSVFLYAVIGLRLLRIRLAMTSRYWQRSIRHLTSMSSFHQCTKLTLHSIVLFYDLFQHRACSYTQSLAFGYSVSAWRWQAYSGHDQFATWLHCPLSISAPNWRPTLLFYSMTFSNTERVSIRSHWPSGTPYPPGDDKQILATINSPPDINVLFPSAHQADDPLHYFILWPFLTQSVFLYEIIGLRLLRIRLAMTSRFWPRSILHLTGLFSFHRHTKPTIQFIILFYDPSQHRAYSYKQSLAFGYSVPTWQWQSDSGDDQFSTWQDCSLSIGTPRRRSTSLFYSMTFPNTERIPIRSYWPSVTPYPPGDDKQVSSTINSPPDRTVLFPSVHQADHPIYCF